VSVAATGAAAGVNSPTAAERPAVPDEAFTFRPLPLLGNPHVQTLLSTCLPDWPIAMPASERNVVLPDGDRIVVQDSHAETWRDGDPIALLVHGLSGSHASGYMRRMARLLMPLRVRVVRFDLRGSGRGLALARTSYHAGCSDDVRAVAVDFHRQAPNSPIFLIGFSLGGNIVLKLAGEAGVEPLPGLARVAAVAPPIDLARCADLIVQPRNRFYNNHFVRELMALVRERKRYFPHLRRLQFPERLGLRDFDEIYTAPQAGFRDADDYYCRAAALPHIPRIQVPTLILTARDDPFVPAEPFERLSAPAHVDVRILPRGGHLGFLGADGAGGIRWAERCITSWLLP
jgi:predicted alpha/beta-fold hydrolase